MNSRHKHYSAVATSVLGMALTMLSPVAFSQETAAVQPEKKPEVRLPGIQPAGEILLPTGWSIRAAGAHINVGDFPVNIAIAPDGKFAAVLHAGYGQHEVIVLDLASKAIKSRVVLPQTFYGLSFSPDGKTLYASGGEFERIHAFDYDQGFLSRERMISIVPVAETFVPCGITPTSDGQKLLVCGVLGHKLARVSLEGKGSVELLKLPADSYPYAVQLSRDEKLAYVSLWGASSIAVVDLQKWQVVHQWSTRPHPCELKLIRDEQWLLVACADDNAVMALDAKNGQAKELISTALYPRAKNGSTPTSMSLSPDEKVLLVANADNNNVAVFDIAELGQSHSLGFIPTGWYPTSVRYTGKGDSILVANGKGLTSRPNPQGPNPGKEPLKNVRQYIGDLLQGTLSIIPPPSPQMMAQYTRAAMQNSPLQIDSTVRTETRDENNPIPAKVGDPSPIKHCIYIIKENRTYDQVFGDLPEGNGDPNLCLFPERVTPNHHALARQFVLLDNTYVESEVSADGHEWSMAAYATDFVEKAWPLSYRGGKDKFTYPSEGNLKIAQPSSGYIWDACKKANVDYFSFGEFIDNGPTPDSPATTTIESLQGHFDPLFHGYDLKYPDVKRAERFITRFKQFEQEDNLPGMIILRLPNDHTSGTRPGVPTPTAMVADNDLALGMVVEAVSKSKYWKETAIFVVQDDTQNGSDHVDAHRTVALVISPYTKKHYVDSTMYSTASMLRSMELILGVEPMSQFDAAATPMYQSFQATPDLTPYDLRPAQVDLNELNKETAFGAKLSMELDLSREDAADDLLLSEIVWKAVRGVDSVMPPPVRAAFVFAVDEDEDEDEEDEDEDEEHDEKDRK